MNNRISSRDILKDVGYKLLSEGKTIRIKAHGYSMYPTIKPGAIILIEPLHLQGEPSPGEIIAIRRGSGLIVHRLTKIVVKNNISCFIARGDCNAYADNAITIDKIAGRVVGAATSGENPIPANIGINTKPAYILNRLRVICIFIRKKIHWLK